MRRPTLKQIRPERFMTLVRLYHSVMELVRAQGVERLRQILGHLGDSHVSALYYCLADWLNAQSTEFGALLRELDTSGALRRWLYDALNVARMEAEFSAARADSRVRGLYLAELFPGIEDVSVPVGAINEMTGLPNKVDMLYVCAIARGLGAKRIFEFGTYMGRTTFYLAQSVPGAEVYTLNLPVAQAGKYAPYVGAYLDRRGKPANIHQLFADSRTFEVGALGQAMDLVFIDGDHSYGMVESDTGKALEMLSPGGTIIWHDYAAKTPGVYRFIRDFSKARSVFHVRNTALAVYRDRLNAMDFVPAELPRTLESEFSRGR
jgi:predicted O-methyltransferase YrrM